MDEHKKSTLAGPAPKFRNWRVGSTHPNQKLFGGQISFVAASSVPQKPYVPFFAF